MIDQDQGLRIFKIIIIIKINKIIKNKTKNMKIIQLLLKIKLRMKLKEKNNKNLKKRN